MQTTHEIIPVKEELTWNYTSKVCARTCVLCCCWGWGGSMMKQLNVLCCLQC